MLRGLGDELQDALAARGLRVRTYCPVGDLVAGMAYLVRRLLENTSNESFLTSRRAERPSRSCSRRPDPIRGPAPVGTRGCHLRITPVLSTLQRRQEYRRTGSVEIVLIAKMTGRYDHDEVVLRKSTLDEIPALLALAGAFALAWSVVAFCRRRVHLGAARSGAAVGLDDRAS